jgi:arylsulfatase A-like enzyme
MSRTLFWRQPYPPGAPHAAARQEKWKYLRTGDQEFLYDLSVDPGEKADLKARAPDAFERLRAAWREWSSHMATVPKPAG